MVTRLPTSTSPDLNPLTARIRAASTFPDGSGYSDDDRVFQCGFSWMVESDFGPNGDSSLRRSSISAAPVVRTSLALATIFFRCPPFYLSHHTAFVVYTNLSENLSLSTPFSPSPNILKAPTPGKSIT